MKIHVPRRDITFLYLTRGTAPPSILSHQDTQQARYMWKPGQPKPDNNRSNSGKKRKRKKASSTANSNPNELVPLQNPPKRDASKPMLSTTVKSLKFMQRQVDSANAARARRDRERAERERHWVVDHPSSSSSSSSSSFSSSSSTSSTALNGGFVVVRDETASSLGPRCTLSRRSFRGFNVTVERQHISIHREKQALAALDDVEEDAIGDEEMADTLGRQSNNNNNNYNSDGGKGRETKSMKRKAKTLQHQHSKGRRKYG